MYNCGIYGYPLNETYRNGGRNMKKIAVYAISFFSLVILLTTCYFLSYRFALKQFNDKATEQSEEVKKISLANIQNESQDVAVETKKTVSVDAVYLEKIYDVNTEELKEESKNIPNDFVGKTRQEIIEKLNDYVQNKTLDEYNAGLISFELESFSPEKIVVKKTYNSKAIIFKYYMCIENNQVVVYYSNREDLYDANTGVLVEDLSEEDKIKLMYGKYLEDETEIYSILENYTS